MFSTRITVAKRGVEKNETQPFLRSKLPHQSQFALDLEDQAQLNGAAGAHKVSGCGLVIRSGGGGSGGGGSGGGGSSGISGSGSGGNGFGRTGVN